MAFALYLLGRASRNVLQNALTVKIINSNISFVYSIKELFNKSKLHPSIVINTGESREKKIVIFQKDYNLICIQGEKQKFNEILQDLKSLSPEDFRIMKRFAYNQKNIDFIEFIIDLDNKDWMDRYTIRTTQNRCLVNAR